MSPSANPLSVLMQIHKTKIDTIQKTHDEVYEEVAVVVHKEIDASREIHRLQDEQKKLRDRINELESKESEAKDKVYEKHKLPRSSWKYHEQLLKKENDRYEKELDELNNALKAGGDSHA